MGVIINDFEMSGENPLEASGEESQAGTSSPVESLTSRDVWELFILQVQRRARLRAD